MSNHDKESNKEQHEFEQYLSGNSDLSDLYQDNGSGLKNLPGTELDNVILAAARKEVGSRPQSAKATFRNFSPFNTSYLIPLSTAASILLVVALLSYFPEQHEISFEADLASQQGSSDTSNASLIIEKQHLIIEQAPERKRDSNSVVTPEYLNSAPIVESVAQSSIKPSSVSGAPQRLKAKLPALGKAKQRLSSSVVQSKSAAKRKNKERVLLKTIAADSVLAEPQHNMNMAVAEYQDSDMLSPVESSDELTYNEFQWQNLTATQWQQRIIKIVKLGDKSKAQKIIKIFNNKFPDLKMNINDIIKELK